MLVGALALILVVGVAGTVLFATRTWPPLAATYDFTDDLREGNVDGAIAQMCERLRTDAGRDNLDAFAREIAVADSLSVDVLSVDRDGDNASVDVTLSYSDDDDDDVTLTLRLVHEDGDWRPCGTDSR